MINHYNSNNLANEKEEPKCVPINIRLRDIGINKISIAREYFNIAFKDNFDISVNNYNSYEDIYEKTKTQLLGNTFVSSDVINTILEFLESNYQIIANNIKDLRGGFS